MMSCLGSIEHLMTSLGPREALELIYAENAVDHVLNGEAYARAFQGRTLLNTLLVSEVYEIPSRGGEDNHADEKQLSERDLHTDLKEAAHIFDDYLRVNYQQHKHAIIMFTVK